MVEIFANGILATIVMLIIMQIGYVVLFVYRLKRNLAEFQSRHPNEFDELDSSTKEGEVAVILCLRGADPGLETCLQGLSRQRYSNFQIHIVVDSLDDPSLKAVNQYSSILPKLEVYPIGNRYNTCSAKCSAILTAIERIPSSVKFIALIDADTIPDRNWLCDLLAPFKDIGIGASTGLRWFESGAPSFGTALRQIWNTAAVVQMGIYNIPWGGSLAIRRELLHSTKLLDRWQHAFCEDTLLTDELKVVGMKLARASGLILVNRETTGFMDAVSWITRQLLTVRLHNPNWPLVQAHALATMSCNLGGLLGLWLLFTESRPMGWALLAAFSIYQITNLWMLQRLQNAIGQTLEMQASRSLQPYHVAHPHPFFLGLAILASQWVYPFACCSASFCRQVRWRGIDYAIKKGGKVEMVKYQPYSRAGRAARNDDSIL